MNIRKRVRRSSAEPRRQNGDVNDTPCTMLQAQVGLRHFSFIVPIDAVVWVRKALRIHRVGKQAFVCDNAAWDL